MSGVKPPLMAVYGDNVVNLAIEEIQKLKENSNIPFDAEYVKLGLSFLNLKANQIIEGKRSHCKLSSLVSESFGEAAIYKYNIKGENE